MSYEKIKGRVFYLLLAIYLGLNVWMSSPEYQRKQHDKMLNQWQAGWDEAEARLVANGYAKYVAKDGRRTCEWDVEKMDAAGMFTTVYLRGGK